MTVRHDCGVRLAFNGGEREVEGMSDGGGLRRTRGGVEELASEEMLNPSASMRGGLVGCGG